jgi:hypothetical protein
MCKVKEYRIHISTNLKQTKMAGTRKQATQQFSVPVKERFSEVNKISDVAESCVVGNCQNVGATVTIMIVIFHHSVTIVDVSAYGEGRPSTKVKDVLKNCE